MKQLVSIIFWDHVNVSGETSLSKIKATTPVECQIYGEVVAEAKEYVTVLAYHEGSSDDEVELENFAMVIVKSTIIERRDLVEKNGKLKK